MPAKDRDLDGEVVAEVSAVAPPRARGHIVNPADRLFAAVLSGAGLSVLALAAVIALACYVLARPALAHLGTLSFLLGREWNPVANQFGALPFVYGTLVTSAVAVAVALPVALGLALFLSELAPRRLQRVVSYLVEILAGVPSVVYGLWGLYVLVPWLRDHVEPWLGHWLGFLPLFSGPPLGLGYLAAGLVLAIMILPTIAAVGTEVLRTTPPSLREGALALGATRWEAIRMAVLPYAKKGLLGAVVLGLGRALGETMAVTMVIGNSPTISASLFSAGYSLPSIIANEFAEANGEIYVGALAALALVLFAVTLLLNMGARLLVRLSSRQG